MEYILFYHQLVWTCVTGSLLQQHSTASTHSIRHLTARWITSFLFIYWNIYICKVQWSQWEFANRSVWITLHRMSWIVLFSSSVSRYFSANIRKGTNKQNKLEVLLHLWSYSDMWTTVHLDIIHSKLLTCALRHLICSTRIKSNDPLFFPLKSTIWNHMNTLKHETQQYKHKYIYWVVC